MAYIPSHHTVSNKPYGCAQSVPTDGRSYFYDEGLFRYRPYQSVEEALNYLNQDKFRRGHFSIFINETGSLNADSTFTGGELVEFWFQNGISDSDLIPKSKFNASFVSEVIQLS